MRINIVTPPQTKFAAICLANKLTAIGYEIYVSEHLDNRDKHLHIIFCAACYHAMPKHYILYQTEVHSSHWFSAKYLGFIKNSISVWEYQQGNAHKYAHLNKPTHIVPPEILTQPKQVKDISVLFYGMINKRREAMLKEIAKTVPVKIVNGLTGLDMWRVLARSKVVINLHYYENAPLEIFRVNEALSFGCHVVSEEGTGSDNYRDIVTFNNNPAEIANAAKMLCAKPFKHKISTLPPSQDYSALISSALSLSGKG